MIIAKRKVDTALGVIGAVSPECEREINGVLCSHSTEPEEIRLRAEGLCSVRINGRDYPLSRVLGEKELRDILERLTGGALYAERDRIRDGYVTIDGGIRIGVAGRASYNGGECIGIYDISSLVFRIPRCRSSFAEEVFRLWQASGEGGMLILSPPGGGKTTLLRSLASYVGQTKRLAVADERCEFSPEDYSARHVDILRGYKRASGIEIAVRTMSPEVIMCDEIFSREDSEALLGALGAGVTVIATAHGTDIASIRRRNALSELLDAGMFSSLVTVVREDGKFGYTFEELR